MSALGAGLALPLLAACAGSSPQTLAFGQDLDGAALGVVLRASFIPAVEQHTRGLTSQWQAERNASIDVELSSEWREIAAKTAEARRGADVAELFGNTPHLLSERLVDVSHLAERIGETLGGWSDAARDSCMVDGVWRAIPWSLTWHALVSRTDLLREVGAGEPDSYDDLLDVAVRLHDAGAPPVGFTMGESGPNDSATLAYNLLWSFGGHEVDESGRVALDSSATLAAVEYFANLALVNAAGAFDYSEVGNNDAYLAGEIAITQNASSIYWKAQELDLPIAATINHVPFPTGPAGRIQLPEVNSLGIFRHSPEPTAALDLIEFLTSGNVMVERARESLAFHVPPVSGLDDNPTMPWTQDARLAGLSASRSEGRMPGWPLPPSLEAGLVYENRSIVNMFGAVGRQQMSPAEAVRTAAEELRRVYET